MLVWLTLIDLRTQSRDVWKSLADVRWLSLLVSQQAEILTESEAVDLSQITDVWPSIVESYTQTQNTVWLVTY